MLVVKLPECVPNAIIEVKEIVLVEYQNIPGVEEPVSVPKYISEQFLFI